MEQLFIVKKILQAVLLPPGIFSVLLLAGLFSIRKIRGYTKTKWLLFAVAVLIYALSIRPVAFLLLKPLEYSQPFPKTISGDVVVALGGGSIADTPDFDVRGSLNGASSARFIMAARAQKMTGAYLLITSGAVLGVKSVECDVYRNYALNLGIPRQKIVVDNVAQDTSDNALNTLKICRERGWKSIILVTSASHMPRARKLFDDAAARLGSTVKIICLPAGYLAPQKYHFVWADLLPDSLDSSLAAIHEYAGLAAGYTGIK